jgi:hypothetical protein
MSTASEMVKRTDVRRFLAVDPEEVDRMIEEDRLPIVKVPGARKPAIRIFLPDFHAWLCGWAKEGAAIKDYQVFRRAFFAAGEG